MKTIVKILLISSAALSMSLEAAEFTTTVQQGTAAHWAQNIWQPGAVPPTAGNTYQAIAGGNPTRLRNPASGSGDPVIGVKTFPGDSLQLEAGSEIRAKGLSGSTANTLNFPGVGSNAGLILNGGNLDNGDNNAIFGLTGVVLVQADSSFTCGDSAANNTRGWLVGAEIRGTANITITKNFPDGAPSVELTGTNNPFSGNWIINGGLFKATAPGSLGSGSITINPGAAGASFEPMYDVVSAGTLTLAAGNTVMRLHQNCSFVAVIIDGVPLFDGTYDYDLLSASYPDHFPPGAGSGSITVQPPLPPPAPANVSVVNGDTQVTLTWSAAPTATGYNVKRSGTAGGPYTSVGTPSGTSFVDVGLVNGSTYYYVVSASNTGGEGPNSSEVIGRPNNTVTGVTATGGMGQVTVAWSPLEGATSYLVRRAANSGGPYADVATVTGTSHVDTTVQSGRNYFYVVFANLAGGGQSGISSEATATTAPSVSSLTPRLFAATAISLVWSNSDPVITQFLLERSADGITFEPLATVPGNQKNYTDSGLPPSTTFFYRVQAQNAAGQSEFSNVASNTTPAFGLNINFANALNGTPANNPAPIPPGYAQDIGEIFGLKTNGLTYGWDRDITVDSRYRNNPNSPDLRYDTFNHLQKVLPSAFFEIQLPVGFYSVRIVSGDPTAVDSTFQMNVEGVDGPSYVPVAGAWWTDVTTEVGVADGRLTINSGPRAANNKMNFIDIYPAVPKPPVIGTQPAGGTTEEFHPLNLSVAMSEGSQPFVYQWYLNGTAITDATNAAYSVPRARSTDAGAYSVIITNWGGAVTSAVANVTVPPDTTPPQMLAMASVDGKTIGVCFSEELENSAGQMTDYFNYSINNGAMFAQSITLRPDGRSVILHLPSPITGEFTVGVNTVNATHADFAGNAIPPTTLTNRVTDWFAADVGGPGLLGQHYTCDLTEFEVVGGGADIWGASDQAYLISRPVTGNFDARVRVTGLSGSNAITKAVLVARESTNANDRAYHISVNPTPPGRNQLELGLRQTVGGGTASWGGVFTPANIPNVWMRITRQDNTFTGYRSADGMNWVAMGTNTLAAGMPATMSVGIGVTAHDNSLLATGMFSNFTITQGATPPTIINSSFAAGRFDLGFATETGVSYRVEYKNDLSDPTWTTLTTVTGDGNPAAINDPTATVPRRFYRIRVE